jgi:mono/diheme cytochrome c family protein
MRIQNIRNILLSFLTVFLTFSLIIAASTSAYAHGKDHQPKDESSDHMKMMQDVKKGIPEDYRIMERTPVIPDEKSLQQGQQLFLDNCVVCHGEKGDGKGSAAAALQTPPANFLDRKHSAMYGPGEKYWIIGNGSGETGMPGFSLLTTIQRWHLVNYIFHLQRENQGELEALFDSE